MSTLIRKGRIWGSALFAVARYMLYNLVLTYSVWLHANKDNWNSLTNWDYHDITTQLILSALVALGAIMNKTWHVATEKDKQP